MNNLAVVIPLNTENEPKAQILGIIRLARNHWIQAASLFQVTYKPFLPFKFRQKVLFFDGQKSMCNCVCVCVCVCKETDTEGNRKCINK